MNLLQSLFLGIVQGLTEFAPVSSSAHLVLVPWLLGWPEPGLAFDTTLHLGTLLAAVAFFWRDLVDIALAFLRSLWERRIGDDPIRRLAWLLVIGTIPAVLAGVLLKDFFEALFSAPLWVAILLLVTGLWLAASERIGKHQRSMTQLNVVDSLLIGLAQAVAIAPGISRSGATIATGLLRGLQREAAARYAFLLSIPIIFGAGAAQLRGLAEAGSLAAQAPDLVIGFIAAAVSGYLCIRFLLRYLQRGRLYAFAIYCWVVGLGVIAIALFRGMP